MAEHSGENQQSSPDVAATLRALRESEARHRAILETAVDAIIIIDERGIIQTVNPAAERVFGWSGEQMLGQPVSMLMPEPFAGDHDAHVREYLRSGKAKIIGIGREVVALRKDGTTFPADLAVSEMREGERRLFTGVLRDLTERRWLERQLLDAGDTEQARLGRDLHDGLGQHLAGLGFLSKALEQRLRAAGSIEADDAAQIAAAATQAIAQARALARGLYPVILDRGLVAALTELAGNASSMLPVKCEFIGESGVDEHNRERAMHLFRIAQEALYNAVRHGGAGHVTIKLGRTRGDARILSIVDDGAGFPEAPRKRDGMGLHTMRYRAAAIGATLMMSSENGARIDCVYPVDGMLIGSSAASKTKQEPPE